MNSLCHTDHSWIVAVSGGIPRFSFYNSCGCITQMYGQWRDEQLDTFRLLQTPRPAFVVQGG